MKEAEHQTWREKQASRRMWQEQNRDVMDELQEAQKMMEERIKEAKEKYEEKIRTEDLCRQKVISERQKASEKLSRAKEGQLAKLESERSGFNAVISQLKQRHSGELAKLKEHIDSHNSAMLKLERKHQHKMKELESKVAEQKAAIHDEKIRRRRTEQRAVDMKKECREQLRAMKLWVEDAASQLKVRRICISTQCLFAYLTWHHFCLHSFQEVKRDARQSASSAAKANSVATNRLKLLADVKHRLAKLQDDLLSEEDRRATAEEELEEQSMLLDKLERMNTIRREIKKEKTVGRKGGAKRWPVHVVMLICEMLVNGTPPSAVPANIQSSCAILNGAEAEELPSIDFVRKCRTVVENLNLMFGGLRLGKAISWHQIFTDGTTRRQIAFQNLVIGLMEDGKFDSVIASSCIFLENKSAAKQVEAITGKVRDDVNPF